MDVRLWLAPAPSELGAAFLCVHAALDAWPARTGDWEELGGAFHEQRKQGPLINLRRAKPARTNHERAIVGSGAAGARLRRLVPLRVGDALQLHTASGFRAGLAVGSVRLEVPPELAAWEEHPSRRARTGDAGLWLYAGKDEAAKEARADAVVDLLRHLAASLALSAIEVRHGDAVQRWTHPAALEAFLESVWITAVVGST